MAKTLFELIHERYSSKRRALRLRDNIADFIPCLSNPGQHISVLDVGCGRGELAYLILRKRQDISLVGIDILDQEKKCIPVKIFDGKTIPYGDFSFDVVTIIDVLHHTNVPLLLLREAKRVSRKYIIIKDHTLNGFLAGPTLKFMDIVGNKRFGVSLPYNYWTKEKWSEAFDILGLKIEIWKTSLRLYPWPASLVFDRALHFIARLSKTI